MWRALTLIGSMCLATIANVRAFPDGAPADTCVRDRVNQPNHGTARPKDLQTLPYRIVANANVYAPGQSIQVTVDGNDVFRGFFLQARDSQTNEWIGQWQNSANTKSIPECASVTHADPRDKTSATFVWHAPHDRQGQVYFTGTIVKDYGNFWANVIAQTAPQH